MLTFLKGVDYTAYDTETLYKELKAQFPSGIELRSTDAAQQLSFNVVFADPLLDTPENRAAITAIVQAHGSEASVYGRARAATVAYLRATAHAELTLTDYHAIKEWETRADAEPYVMSADIRATRQAIRAKCNDLEAEVAAIPAAFGWVEGSERRIEDSLAALEAITW